MLESAPAGLSPRQLRYLGRNSRLAIAACAEALAHAAYPAEVSARERLACMVATTRGATDSETTLEMIRAARAAAGEGGRPVASAALETYTGRRTLVQYLLSMETAVVGQLTAALGARGPAHAITTPGVAGGGQALERAVLAVARGEAPAALACGVLTAEDEPGLAETLDLLGPGHARSVVEGAGAVLVEDAESVASSGREARCRIRIGGSGLESKTGGEVSEGAVTDDALPFAGAARAPWSVAGSLARSLPARVALAGAWGHRFEIELLHAEASGP